MFYLPKTIYENLKTLAKENNISVSKQIMICLEYAQANPPSNYPYTYTEEQLPYIDTVHFSEKFTTRDIKNYVYTHNFTPIQIVNMLNYGQHYKEIEERRQLCQKYKLN